MSEEKSLVKVEKYNIFQKICRFIKKVFTKEKKAVLEFDETEIIEQDELTDEQRRNIELLDIQKKYENGMLEEQNMSDEEKQELKKLYKKQIKTLEMNIAMFNKSIEFYKNKILEMRNY